MAKEKRRPPDDPTAEARSRLRTLDRGIVRDTPRAGGAIGPWPSDDETCEARHLIFWKKISFR